MWVRPIHCVGAAFLVLAGLMTPAWAAGSYALEFDGVNDYVDVPSMEYAFADGDVFTIEVWSRWFDTVRSLCAYRYQLERNRFRTRGSAELAVQTGITNQEWNHVAVVYDGSGATKRLTGYVNGVQTGTANTTGSPLTSYTGNTLRFGMTRHSSGQYSHCMMDEVRVWNIARSVSDIQTYMKKGLSGGEEGLIGYWTFDEGEGTTLYDRSPRGNHGTIAGAAWTTDAAPVTPGPGPAAAHGPFPANAAGDVPRDVVLNWKPGSFAHTHDVYLGTVLDDVDTASRTDARGRLVSRAQDANSYDPAGAIEFGQTYYWRVDEVNAPPSATIVEGSVWSFTVEPYSYPVQPVKATASSAQPGMGPEKTIDGSGMTGELHGTEATTMWLSAGVPPNWIQYEFDQVYTLHELQVWNSNQLVESFLGFGAKGVTIETSTDGATWTPVANVPEFAQAPAATGYAANTTVNLGPVDAKYVKLTFNTTWGGVAPQAGLSEVRFSYVPVLARAPQPPTGATNVGVDISLDWRPGRQAASHQVYFGTDPDAVAQGTVAPKSVTDHSYNPGSLNLGTTYYWKVAEVNEAATPKVREGDVWSLTTREFFVVDDFESYTDEEGSRIYEAWIDGWENKTGAMVGYLQAPFAERTVIHGGKQAMPLDYNNTKAPFYSEAERTFDKVQDWTAHGADTLALWFRGNPAAFAETAPGNITLSGGGADIWNAADEFRFAFKPLTGNGTMVAKVDSLVNTDPWAKAGVMIRESLEPGARFAAVYATPGSGVRYQARLLNAGAAVSDTAVITPEQTALRTPVWVKIERTGSTFNGYYSTNGVQWTAMTWNPQTINMATSVYIGLAATSHNVNAVTTAEFSNVATTGGVSGFWQAQAIGVAQPANDPASLYVAVQDSTGKVQAVAHPDPAATTRATWQQWRIPLSEFSAAGVRLTAVKKLYVGVGDRTKPSKGGAGLVFIDDIGVGHPAATNP
jgi:hypothetical protein